MGESIQEIEDLKAVWIEFETYSYAGSDKNGDVKWVPKKYYRCGKCRKGSVIRTPYCPYCGRKMNK